MSLTTFRAVEPLYVIIMRHGPAEQHFRAWIKQNRIEHAVVNGNRMMLHAQPAFECFRVTWTHGFGDIAVWDTWHRRHVYFD